MLAVSGATIYTSYHRAPKPRKDALTIAVFHGAGTSNSERFTGIAQGFLKKGVSVVALDFIGHGRTGGDMSEGSLALRNQYALAAIDHWLAKDIPLILLGSSMGGHTALRVSASLGTRVKAMCLLQPAIYASDAEDVHFNSEFTEILRRPGSWQSSLALHDAANFAGKVYLAIGSADPVIPWGVIEALAGTFRPTAQPLQLNVFHDAMHTLPEWIPSHPETHQQMIDFILSN